MKARSYDDKTRVDNIVTAEASSSPTPQGGAARVLAGRTGRVNLTGGLADETSRKPGSGMLAFERDASLFVWSFEITVKYRFDTLPMVDCVTLDF